MLQKRLYGQRPAAQRRKPLDDVLLAAALELDQDVLLGGEMEVEGSAGDTGRPDDVVDLGVGVADASELGHRRVEESVACLLALLATSAELEDLDRECSTV